MIPHTLEPQKRALNARGSPRYQPSQGQPTPLTVAAHFGIWQNEQSLLALFFSWHCMHPPIEMLVSRNSVSRSLTGPWHVSHVAPAATWVLCEKYTQLGI